MPHKDKAAAKQYAREYYKNYYLKYPDKRAAARLKEQQKLREEPLKWRLLRLKASYKRQYNLTWDEVLRLFEKQNGKCAICSKMILIETLKQREKALLDHDHLTGKVRGFLCYNCNTALGLFQDSCDILNLAYNYLKLSTKHDS